MKVHSKGPHHAGVSITDSGGRKGVASKQPSGLTRSGSVEPKQIELLNRIKERVKKEKVQGSDKISRLITEEMLRDSLRPKLNEQQFQKMIDRISESIKEDPVLSGHLKKIMTKIS
jgi:uncharacterized protein YpuA (DUF1002 family)